MFYFTVCRKFIIPYEVVNFLLSAEISAARCTLRKDMRFIMLINAVDANFDTL